MNFQKWEIFSGSPSIITNLNIKKSTNINLRHGGGGGSSIVKVPGDVPPARVYFFGLLV